MFFQDMPRIIRRTIITKHKNYHSFLPSPIMNTPKLPKLGPNDISQNEKSFLFWVGNYLFVLFTNFHHFFHFIFFKSIKPNWDHFQFFSEFIQSPFQPSLYQCGKITTPNLCQTMAITSPPNLKLWWVICFSLGLSLRFQAQQHFIICLKGVCQGQNFLKVDYL